MSGSHIQISHGLLIILVQVVLAGGCRPQPKENPSRAKAVIQVDQSLETVAIEPHGRRIAVTRGWGDGLVLELPSGKPAGIPADVLKASTHFAFSQTGKRLAIAGPAGVRVWDFGRESVICMLHCGSDKYTSLAFSTSDDRLYCATSESDPTVWRCDVSNSETVTQFRESDDATLSRGSDGSIRRLLVAPDGKTLAIVFGGGTVLFDIPSQSPRFTLNNDTGATNIVFSADGKKFVRREGKTLQVWDAQNGGSLGMCEAMATALALSTDTNCLLAAVDGREREPNYITAINLKDLRVLHRAYCHDNAIVGLACTPDSVVVSGCADGTVKMWALKDLLSSSNGLPHESKE
jgi:WD40 repeat protein